MPADNKLKLVVEVDADKANAWRVGCRASGFGGERLRMIADRTMSEISAAALARAKAFYEYLLGIELREETIGPNSLAIFPYDRDLTPASRSIAS